MSEVNKLLVGQHLDAALNLDAEGVAAAMRFPYLAVNLLDGSIMEHDSAEVIIAGTEAFLGICSDYNYTIVDQVAEGDRVVSHVHWEGTNDGEFMGKPPTGASISFEVLRIDSIEDGQLVGTSFMQDVTAVATQIAAAASK